MAGFFTTSIEFLKGVGPQRAALLNKELTIFTFGDLIQHYPFRYEDRTKFYPIGTIHDEMPFVQVKGVIKKKELIGIGFKKRLVAQMTDSTGEVELVWFQGINWINDKVKPGVEYIAFGKPTRFGNKFNIAHPELDVAGSINITEGFLQPIYSTTEKLKHKNFDSKALSKLVRELLNISVSKIRETLPKSIIQSENLLSKKEALSNIHVPTTFELLARAQHRLKFEELFYIQLRLLKMKLIRQAKFKGQLFQNTALLNKFYKDHLPFSLTDAQKKVIKEIYADLKSGKQMNRLLQGDVGSGKTIVSFICMLIVLSDSAQCALMAPTEILAQQHFKNLKEYADRMQISIALLTGSTKKTERVRIHEKLQNGELHILIGTHALLE